MLYCLGIVQSLTKQKKNKSKILSYEAKKPVATLELGVQKREKE